MPRRRDLRTRWHSDAISREESTQNHLTLEDLPVTTAAEKILRAQPVGGIITRTTTVSITLLDERHLRTSTDIFLDELLLPAVFACLSLALLAWLVKRLGSVSTRTKTTPPGNETHEDQHPGTSEPEITEPTEITEPSETKEPPPATESLSDNSNSEFDVEEVEDSDDELLTGPPPENDTSSSPPTEGSPPKEEPRVTLAGNPPKRGNSSGSNNSDNNKSNAARRPPVKKPDMLDEDGEGVKPSVRGYDSLPDSESEVSSVVQVGTGTGTGTSTGPNTTGIPSDKLAAAAEENDPKGTGLKHDLELELQEIEKKREEVSRRLKSVAEA